MPGKSGSKDLKVFARSLVVGGVSAAISKTASGPIERIKIVLQVQASNPDIPVEKRYKGITNCAIRMWKDQPKSRSVLVKPLPYWRGNTTNVLRYFPMQAVNFAVKNSIRRKVYSWGNVKNAGFWGEFWRSCLSGGLAGMIGISIVYPLDFARTRMTSDVRVGRKYRGLGDCVKQVVRKEGALALYKGFAPSLMGIFPYRAAYFGFYDLAKKYVFKGEPEKYSFMVKWGVSQTTSVVAQYVAYPFDTVRRRMMMLEGKKPLYSSTYDCFRTIFREEGAVAFFKGAWANTIRATGCALLLVMYDDIGRFLFCDKKF